MTKAIIIGAGRGSRLNALTDDQPKCYAPIGGRRILDWTRDAFAGAGLAEQVFIGGYRLDMIRGDYPEFTFCHNADWPNNNILMSLFHAESHFAGGFVCTYSDILFRASVVRKAMRHPGDIVLCVDTDWRQRYIDRTLHPEQDAEKVTVENDRVLRIDRQVPSDQAAGEYIGVAKFTGRGASQLQDCYHDRRREFAGKPWRGAERFEKAYLIHLFQDMIEQGIAINLVTTHGDYMEIDTEEDYDLANAQWPDRWNDGG